MSQRDMPPLDDEIDLDEDLEMDNNQIAAMGTHMDMIPPQPLPDVPLLSLDIPPSLHDMDDPPIQVQPDLPPSALQDDAAGSDSGIYVPDNGPSRKQISRPLIETDINVRPGTGDLPYHAIGVQTAAAAAVMSLGGCHPPEMYVGMITEVTCENPQMSVRDCELSGPYVLQPGKSTRQLPKRYPKKKKREVEQSEDSMSSEDEESDMDEDEDN